MRRRGARTLQSSTPTESYFLSNEDKMLHQYDHIEQKGLSFKEFCKREDERDQRILADIRKNSTIWTRLRMKLEALLWVVVGSTVFHFSKFWYSLTSNELAGGYVPLSVFEILSLAVVNRPFFFQFERLFYWTFWISLAVMVLLCLYLVVYVRVILRIQDWLDQSDTVIFILTGAFIANGVSILVFMWPIYGYMTPVVIGAISWGLFNLLLLLP